MHPRRTASLASPLLLLMACHAAAPAPAPAVAPRAAAPAQPAQSAASAARPRPVGEAGRLLALAREHNPGLAEARARVAEAAAELAQAEAALWPRLAVDASVLGSDSPSLYLFKAIDAHDLGSVDFNEPGSFQATEAGLTLRWNLWNGGRDRLAQATAAARIAAREAEADACYTALADAVLAAWIDLGLARELAAADEDSVRALEAGVASTARRVAAGSSLRAEQLSLEVRLAEARERRESARLAERRARAGLARLCGPEARASAGAEHAAAFAPPPATLEAATDEALATRAELRALEHALAAAGQELEAERRSGQPTLDLEGRLYSTELDLDPSLNGTNSVLMLGLRWDLADGGARSARRSAAEARLRQLQERRREASSSVALEVENAWWELEHARVQCTLAESALRAADETLAVVGQQHENGSATVSRFLEVEADRSQSRAALARARLGGLRAEARLASTLGRWSR